MRPILWFMGVPLAALAGGATGAAPVYVMGLSVSMTVIGPLTLLSGALLATLCAGWTANFAASGASARTRSRLPAVMAVSLLAGVAAIVVGFASAGLFNALELDPSLAFSLLIYGPGAMLFALATAFAVWRLRAPTEGGLGAAALALAVCGAWLAFLAVAGGLVYLLGFGSPDLGTGISVAAIVGGGLALAVPGAALGVWRSGLMRDAGLSLGAVGLLPAAISASIYLGCSAALCGP